MKDVKNNVVDGKELTDEEQKELDIFYEAMIRHSNTPKAKTKNEENMKTKSYSTKVDMKLDNDLRNANPCYTADEKEAMLIRFQQNKKLDYPIVGWKETETLVYGYTEYELATQNRIHFDVELLSFANKQDALDEAISRKLLCPTINLFQKCEAGRPFGDYWQQKYDREHPVCKAALQRFGSVDALGIVAIKAGTSRQTANKVNRILESKNEDLIDQCQRGVISIDTAYNQINGSNAPEENEKKSDDKVSSEKTPEIKKIKSERLTKRKDNEIASLVKYTVDGFYNREKLDEHGLKYFVLRWNEEHPDNQMKLKEVQQAISAYKLEPAKIAS